MAEQLRQRSELETPQVEHVLKMISAVRRGILENQKASLGVVVGESACELIQLCEKLRAVDLSISGVLYGIGGSYVDHEAPRARVEDLAVRVESARVDTQEYPIDEITRQSPFVDILAITHGTKEIVNARLGIGRLGVFAEAL